MQHSKKNRPSITSKPSQAKTKLSANNLKIISQNNKKLLEIQEKFKTLLKIDSIDDLLIQNLEELATKTAELSTTLLSLTHLDKNETFRELAADAKTTHEKLQFYLAATKEMQSC